MSPKGPGHELVREELTFRFTKSAPLGIFVAAEPQLNLSADTYTVPDILVRPAAIKTPDLRGNGALLLVEIADSSLGYDIETKAPIYASNGIPEYWVINALTLMTTVHLRPMAVLMVPRRSFPPRSDLLRRWRPNLPFRSATSTRRTAPGKMQITDQLHD